MLKGYCEGYFGRDHHEDVVIIAEGHDWLVARGVMNSTYVTFTTFDNVHDKLRFINKHEVSGV